IVLSGQEALQRVEARAERHSRRMDWLAQAAPSLPEGWRQAAETLLRALESRRLEQAWKTDRNLLWGHLFSIVQNAAPVSHIFWPAFDDPRLHLSEDAIELLGSVQGPGRLFASIRGPRSRQMLSAFKLIEPQPRNWLLNFHQATDFARFFRGFLAFDGHAK